MPPAAEERLPVRTARLRWRRPAYAVGPALCSVSDNASRKSTTSVGDGLCEEEESQGRRGMGFVEALLSRLTGRAMAATSVSPDRPSRAADSAEESGGRRSGERRVRARPFVVFCEACRPGESGRTLDEMIGAGRVDGGAADAGVAVDIPLASTSGTVAREEFWRERSRFCESFDFAPLGATLYRHSPHSGDVLQHHREVPMAKPLEHNVNVDENHSVSNGLHRGKQADERSIWLSSSHKWDGRHAVATRFANDLRGGSNLNINTRHDVTRHSNLSTCLQTDSLGDRSLQVELQREKKREEQEVVESIMMDLESRQKLVKLQTKSAIRDIELSKTFISNMGGQHALRFVATIPVRSSGCVAASIGTEFPGGQKYSVNAVQKIRDQTFIDASLTTDLKQDDTWSFEAKHHLDASRTLAVAITNIRQGVMNWNAVTSLTTEADSWLLTLRNFPEEGQMSGLEWRRELSPDQFFSVRGEAKNSGCAISTEMCFGW